MRWRGEYNAPESGRYRFSTTSDDGSRLYINYKLVVDNDGVHAAQTRTGIVPLTKAWHKITITFFENWGQASLVVKVQQPSWRQGLALRSDSLRPFVLTATESRGCEDSEVTLACKHGVISVISASYGRKHGPDVCPHKETSNRNCHAPESQSIVTRLCSGKPKCVIKASGDTFGDPCAGTYKYLTAQYLCIAGPPPPPPPKAKCYGKCGLFFEAFAYPRWPRGQMLKSWETTVHDDNWNKMKPSVAHPALANEVW